MIPLLPPSPTQRPTSHETTAQSHHSEFVPGYRCRAGKGNYTGAIGSGAAIQKHRVQIPPVIQALGASADLEGRLRTTFDLLGKSSKLSSDALEADLKKIRDTFTPTLGKSHGRAVLKSAKPHFESRVEAFQEKLTKHQLDVATNLQEDLNKSRAQVVEYYLPLAIAKPPDAITGGSMVQPPPAEAFEKWDRVYYEFRAVGEKKSRH